MRRLTAAALALSICTFLSPGVALAAGATFQLTPTGEVLAILEKAATAVPQSFLAELVDANGKVVSTQRTTDGTFNFKNVPPGSYTVRVVLPEGVWLYSGTAGSASVTVAAGATSTVTVGINAAAAAAAASAASAAGSTAVAGGAKGSFGFGTAGTVLAGAAAAGIITAVALTRNNDSSPSR